MDVINELFQSCAQLSEVVVTRDQAYRRERKALGSELCPVGQRINLKICAEQDVAGVLPRKSTGDEYHLT